MTFTPGEIATLTVGVTGRVTAVGDGTVTIGDVVLPTHVGPHAGLRSRYVSDEIPEPAATDPDHDCDDTASHDGCLPDDHVCDDDVDTELRDAVDREHYDHHDGPQRFCKRPACALLEGRRH